MNFEIKLYLYGINSIIQAIQTASPYFKAGDGMNGIEMGDGYSRNGFLGLVRFSRGLIYNGLRTIAILRTWNDYEWPGRLTQQST